MEAPLSGMSINPTRSFGSAIATGSWHSFWLYIISPVVGMQLSAFLFRNFYFSIFGQGKTMKCFKSGLQFSNRIYQSYSWFQKNEKGATVKVYVAKKEDTAAIVVSIQY